MYSLYLVEDRGSTPEMLKDVDVLFGIGVERLVVKAANWRRSHGSTTRGSRA